MAHGSPTLGLGRGRQGSGRGVTSFLALGALLLTLPLLADDKVTAVLGTGSSTGAVTAAAPAASGVGKWIQATGAREDTTFLSFQLAAMGSTTIVIQASMDGTTIDTPYTFTASGQIYTIPACGGCIYRAVCTAYTSGSPVVSASASGRAQVTVLP